MKPTPATASPARPEGTRGSGAGAPAAIPPPIAAQIDATLRLIAGTPVPGGLEKRIHAALAAPRPWPARVLPWPAAAWPSSLWPASLRAAAAAAIVVIVTGGGFGVYSRVQHGIPVAAPAAQQGVVPAGAFSSAGAIRTPQTIQGPAVHPDRNKARLAKRKTRRTPLKTSPARSPLR